MFRGKSASCGQNTTSWGSVLLTVTTVKSDSLPVDRDREDDLLGRSPVDVREQLAHGGLGLGLEPAAAARANLLGMEPRSGFDAPLHQTGAALISPNLPLLLCLEDGLGDTSDWRPGAAGQPACLTRQGYGAAPGRGPPTWKVRARCGSDSQRPYPDSARTLTRTARSRPGLGVFRPNGEHEAPGALNRRVIRLVMTASAADSRETPGRAKDLKSVSAPSP